MSTARRPPIRAREKRSLTQPWWSIWSSWSTWGLILVCAFVCGGATVLGGILLEQPMYRASATVTVTRAKAASGTKSTTLNTALVPSYAQLAISRPVLAAVVTQYPDMTADSLAREVSVSTNANAGTFSINVLDSEAARASLLVRDVANEAVTQVQRAVQEQYDVLQQQVQQDLRTTNAQIESDSAARNSATPPPVPQQRAVLQSQLDYLRQRLAGDQQALSLIEAARSTTPRALTVGAISQGQEVRSSDPLATGGIAALCGAVLGIVLAFALALRRQRIRGPRDVEVLLGSPVLAVLSVSESAMKGASEGALPALPEETARVIPRSLFVTSVRGSSPTGFVAQQLALILSHGGSKTLLVDADLHTVASRQSLSALNPLNDLGKDAGLTDVVLATATSTTATTTRMSLANAIYDFVPATSAGLAMRVIPAGTPAPNPLGVLQSDAMGAVYQQLLAYGADRLIFSGPALLDSEEAPFLAGQLDAVVLMVDPRRHRRADLLAAEGVLRASRAHLLGSILIVDSSRAQRAADARKDKGGRSS